MAGGPTPNTEFNINNNNREEVAVYLGFVWQLCRGRHVLAIPSGSGAYPAAVLGGSYDLVAWDFQVELDEGSSLGDVIGFLPALTGGKWRPTVGDEDETDVPLTDQESYGRESMSCRDSGGPSSQRFRNHGPTTASGD